KNPLSTVFNAGTTTVKFTATDNVGLTSVCSLTVTVNANSTPVLSNCPANISVDAQGANCSAKVGWQAPTAIDACGITPITPTANFAPNANFPVGVNTVTYVATDGQGNTSTCSFTVTVRDLQKPTITCPGSYVLPVDSSQCCAAGGFQMPIATDNCDQNLTITSNFISDDIFCIGTTEVDFTATDDFGNSASCTFTITVLDQYAPEVISCPADIVVSTSPNNCGATVNWDIPVFLDGCTDSLIIIHVYNPNTLFAIGTTVVEYYAADSWAAPLAIDNCPNITLSSLPAPNTPFPVGSSTIVYTAKDASGNTSTCTFSVNVSEKKPPVFSNCPGDFLLTNVDPCNARPPWTAFPSATDNCSAVTIDSSTYRPGDAFPVGTTKVTITATDGSGNVDTCSFIV
ncbi:MAG: HYR domain-containing protein, partial [Chitinophagia bacterium]|nr:HYR domain-containing protein [Chitinophagia bacterium]